MKKNLNYQNNYSMLHKQILYKGRKYQKAKKIYRVISDFATEDPAKFTCLDIGCSGGIISSFIGNHFYKVIGIDIDKNAIEFARSNFTLKNVEFRIGDTMNLDFPDKIFDVVVCNHIYEHVPDAERLFDEIYRVLKDEGFCYLAAGNRLVVMEGHYKVPFLSWLPQYAADLYLQALGKGTHYYENLRTLWGLKKLAKNFKIYDYTIKILNNSKYFFAEDLVPKNFMVRALMLFIAPKVYFLLPNYIWILTKNK